MVCPFEIDFPEVTASLRSLVVEQGAGFVPVSIKGALSSLSSSGNPWKEDVTERSKWLSGLDLSKDAADQKTEIILFLGCLPGYDPRARKAAEAAMRLLQLAGISYEIMAAEEVCCGDTARRIGDFSTFERLKEKNKENLLRTGIKDIYALSPHCAESFQKFYGWDEESVRIHPILNIIHDAIHYGKIKAPKFPQQRVTFHDPCFFSKHMGIAEEPRDILDSIPGLERVEMEHSGRNSLCCGGGGGGIWRDTRKGERLAEVRLDEALASGAEVVVTACPYCLSMLEDARAGGNKYQKLAITDICELVWKGIIS
jgi:Fe-S oxidoreductase